MATRPKISNKSEDFKVPGESKVALDTYYKLERREGESSLEFRIRQGWWGQIWESMVVDFLILNRDWYGANLEMLRNLCTRTVHLAPLLDYELSLMFRAHTDEEVVAFDVTPTPIRSFLGSHSAWDNLLLILVDELPRFDKLREGDRDRIRRSR